MNLNEKMVQFGTLKEVTELTGGRNGKVFKLVNTAEETLVVKFQNDHPAEAIAGTAVMAQAKVKAPRVRRPVPMEMTRLRLAIGFAPYASREAVNEVNDALTKYKVVLFMDFAEGQTIGTVRDTELDIFLAVLRDPGFQAGLGRIVAADSFAGNQDRMFAVRDFQRDKVTGWYNQGNLFINGKTPVAIDNAFVPSVQGYMPFCYSLPWGGLRGKDRWGSVASCFDQHSKEEAAKLCDRLYKTARKKHPAQAATIDAEKAKYRDDFIKNFSNGATAAMAELLAHRGWKTELRDCGAEPKMLDQFRTRKRLLRQLAAGVEPKAAYERAVDQDKYRKWFLTRECDMPEDAPEELFASALKDYKTYKQAHRVTN